MNNKWIECSKRVGGIYSEKLEDHCHESWLDCLGFYETSWMLFVGQSEHDDGNFGWPGAHIKRKKIWIKELRDK